MNCLDCELPINLSQVAHRDYRIVGKPALMVYPVYTCKECFYRPRKVGPWKLMEVK